MADTRKIEFIVETNEYYVNGQKVSTAQLSEADKALAKPKHLLIDEAAPVQGGSLLLG